MSWTSPRTWIANETITAANLNTHVRDNLAWLGVDKVACRLYNSAGQTINDSTLTAITFNAEYFDTAYAGFGMHDTLSNTTRITFRVAGVAIFGGGITWAQNATGYRDLSVRLNGTTTIAPGTTAPGRATYATYQDVVGMYQFAANDYIELMAFQNSGGTVNSDAFGNHSPQFWACWLRV